MTFVVIFPRADTLKSHVRTHRDRQRLPCSLCSKTFLNSRELIQHKRQSHPVTATSTKPSDAEGVISCEQCDEKFQSLWYLMRHRETQHAPALEQPVIARRDRVYNCNFCGFRCADGHRLIRHNTERKHQQVGFGQPNPQRALWVNDQGQVDEPLRDLYRLRHHEINMHDVNTDVSRIHVSLWTSSLSL